MFFPGIKNFFAVKRSGRIALTIAGVAFGIFLGAGLYATMNANLVRAALSGGTVSFNNDRLTNVADPVANSDAATKNYVLSQIGSKTLHTAVYSSGSGIWNWSSAGSPGKVYVTVCGGGGAGGAGSYGTDWQGSYWPLTGCGGTAGSCSVGIPIIVSGNTSYSVGVGGVDDNVTPGNSSFGSFSASAGTNAPDAASNGGCYNGAGGASSFAYSGAGGTGGTDLVFWCGGGYCYQQVYGSNGNSGVVIVNWYQ